MKFPCILAALVLAGCAQVATVTVVKPHLAPVFVPGSPNPASGTVQIVARSRVRMLKAGIAEIGTALQQFGVGSAKVLAKDRSAAQSAPAPPAAPQS